MLSEFSIQSLHLLNIKYMNVSLNTGMSLTCFHEPLFNILFARFIVVMEIYNRENVF